jgi:hypothetical protein
MHKIFATLLISLMLTASGAAAQASGAATLPPAPIRGFLPEAEFEPANQCRGEFAVARLERMLPDARLAMQVPATEAVGLDRGRRCITISVQDVETGRLDALLLRGMGIPRRAVLLELTPPREPGA